MSCSVYLSNWPMKDNSRLLLSENFTVGIIKTSLPCGFPIAASEQVINGVTGYEAEQNNEKSGKKRFFALRVVEVN